MDSNKKRKNQFHKPKGNFSMGKITDEMSGFVCTCDQNREKLAIREAYNILNEYSEKVYGPLEEMEENSDLENKDVEPKKEEETTLESELKKLRDLKKRPFQQVDIGVSVHFSLTKKGVFFIKINPKFKKLSSVKIVDKIMEDIHVNGMTISKS